MVGMAAAPLVAHAAAALAQLLAILALAPLIQGIIKQVKARCQNRRGPSILQPYYDLAKYLPKTSVISEHASWVSRLTPYVVTAAIWSATLFVPLVLAAPLAPFDDIILFLALFALARVWTVLASLDTGSAFGGMGGSRDVMVAVLAEPGLILVLFAAALRSGTLSLTGIAQQVAAQGPNAISPGFLLAGLALALVAVAETGRLPVDNPDTHLELTMIHEGMLLEHSGRALALMLWAQMVKQLLIITLFVCLFLPWTGIAGATPAALALDALIYAAKVVAVAAVLGVVEMLEPKLRLFRLPQYLGSAYLVALLALIANVVAR